MSRSTKLASRMDFNCRVLFIFNVHTNYNNMSWYNFYSSCVFFVAVSYASARCCCCRSLSMSLIHFCTYMSMCMPCNWNIVMLNNSKKPAIVMSHTLGCFRSFIRSFVHLFSPLSLSLSFTIFAVCVRLLSENDNDDVVCNDQNPY